MIQFIHGARQLIDNLICNNCKIKYNNHIEAEYRENEEYDVKWSCDNCGKENNIHMTPPIKGGFALPPSYGREIIVMPKGKVRKEQGIELPEGTCVD